MANNCSKLMKEALDSFLGIEYRYKMNDLLDSMPNNQKFTSEQLKGYMLKQGVSPKEIEASNIFKGFENDNRALTIEEWKGINPSSQELRKSQSDMIYKDITLGRQGVDNPTYHVNEFLTKDKVEGNTNLRHKMQGSSMYDENTQLGWTRVHQDTINGKPTTVLNELQSDWMQAERQGAGTFESNRPTQIQVREARNLVSKYLKANNINIDDLIRGKVVLPPEIAKADKLVENYANPIIKDFPMKPEKFQQLMIVDGINKAISNGTMRVAIPIERTGSDLVGTEGVTKFYESLNKKILPDIRSKLEKQGLRIKVSQEDYKSPTSYLPGIDTLIDEILIFAKDNNYASADILGSKIANFESKNGLIKTVDDLKLWAKEFNYIDMLEEYLNTYSLNNKLHILEIEEVPNAKVKWDVYGLLASIGLGAYASKSEASTQISKDSLAPRELAIETKQTQKAIADDKLDLATLMPERPYEINPKEYKDTNKGIKSYIASIESRGVTDPYKAKNKSTGAEGKYQILPSNYEELARKTKIPMSELTKPSNQEKVMDYLVGEYKDRLETWNIPVNKENIFVLHNLGMTGGLRVLRGTYQASDIVKMSKQLPSNMPKDSVKAILNNYATMYNIDIPKRRRA